MLIGGITLVSVIVAVIISIGAQGLNWLWMVPVLSLGFVLLGVALAFVFLLVLAAAVDLKKEQKKDSRLYRKTIELYLQSALPLLRWHIRVNGMEKVPQAGRFMLVCNHVSIADPVVLLRAFTGKQLAFISKKENQSMFIVGKVMHKMLCQPINRENDKDALKTIIRCIQILRDDKASVAVFPEGYIHEDKKLHHFRSGVFKIAKKTDVPIVVCTMKNTKNAVSNLLHHRRTDITVNVLQTVMPEEYKDITTVELGERIYQIMAKDLGPENVAQET